MIEFSNLKKFLIFILIGSLVVAAAVAIITVLIGQFNEATARVFATLAMAVIHSLISLAFIWDDTKHDTFDRLSFFINTIFIIIIISFVASLFSIWEIISLDTTGHLYQTLFILGFAALHLDILSKALNIEKYINIIVFVNYLFIAIVVLMLQPIVYLTDAKAILGDFYYRLLAASAIVDSTLSILTIIFYRLYIHQHPELRNIFQGSNSSEAGGKPKKGLSVWVWILIIYLILQVLLPLLQWALFLPFF